VKLLFAPSILSFDHSALREPVKDLMNAGGDWIHCDIMDGQFVPPITFGAGLVKALGKIGDTPREAHLMTLSPERHFDDFIAAGCQRIIFHVEATAHAHRLIEILHDKGVQAGVAINPGTHPSAVEAIVDNADLILVMTVNPGWGGQQFIAGCLDKVRTLRAMRADLNIEVDGGIDTRTIVCARDAGANVFVAGSFLAEAKSPAAGLADLRNACGSN